MCVCVYMYMQLNLTVCAAVGPSARIENCFHYTFERITAVASQFTNVFNCGVYGAICAVLAKEQSEKKI